MSDDFATRLSGLESPAEYAAEVAPNDSADLSSDARALYVGGAGNVKVTTTGGSTVTFTGVVAGSVLPVRARRVFATGTTATGIVALW